MERKRKTQSNIRSILRCSEIYGIPNSMIQNHMVVDELWEEATPKRCRICKQINCICEDERD